MQIPEIYKNSMKFNQPATKCSAKEDSLSVPDLLAVLQARMKTHIWMQNFAFPMLFIAN